MEWRGLREVVVRIESEGLQAGGREYRCCQEGGYERARLRTGDTRRLLGFHIVKIASVHDS